MGIGGTKQNYIRCARSQVGDADIERSQRAGADSIDAKVDTFEIEAIGYTSSCNIA